MRRVLLAVLVVVGAALVAFGFGLLHPAAGFIVLGLELGVAGLLLDDGVG